MMEDKDLFVTDHTRPHLGGNLLETDGSTFWPGLQFFLRNNLQAETVLDVGCGTGEAGRYFREKCGCQVIGIEGLEQNAAKCGFPCIVHDFTDGPVILDGIDLVWCVEVLEHVSRHYEPYLMSTLTQAKHLVITHALPGQGGYHHVNYQPSEYWIERFRQFGFLLDFDLTEGSKKYAPNSFWSQSGKVFHKELI